MRHFLTNSLKRHVLCLQQKQTFQNHLLACHQRWRAFSSGKPTESKFWILLYTYGGNPSDLVERRAPFRPEHLALAKEYTERGNLLLGGAFADPIDGAALVFRGTKEELEEFVQRDPYVTKGIVTKHVIREWTVVAGKLFSS